MADQLREEGFEAGEAEALASAYLEIVVRILQFDFGPITPAAETRIRGADIDTLQRWADRLPTAATLDELLA